MSDIPTGMDSRDVIEITRERVPATRLLYRQLPIRWHEAAQNNFSQSNGLRSVETEDAESEPSGDKSSRTCFYIDVCEVRNA